MRILFSYDTVDPWIFETYKLFHEQMSDTGVEVFCTCVAPNETDQIIRQYKAIDYDRIAMSPLGMLGQQFVSLMSNASKDQLAKKALWSTKDSIIIRAAIYKFVLHILEPDLVIIWNGMADVRYATRTLVAGKGMRILYAEKGMLPESWYVDQNGINALSSIDKKMCNVDMSDESINQTAEYISKIIDSGNSAWRQPARESAVLLRDQLGLKENTRIILFAGQVDSDTNVTDFSPFDNVSQAVELTAGAIPNGDMLVIKPHPLCSAHSRLKLQELAKQHPNLIILGEANIWDAIEISDVIVTINSTVAFEALLRKKPIIVLGDGVISLSGLVNVTPPKELREKLSQLLEQPDENTVDFSRVMRLVYSLKNHYYIFRDQKVISEAVLKKMITGKMNDSKAFAVDEITGMLYGKC